MELFRRIVTITFVLLIIATGCSRDKYENEDNLVFIGASENWYVQFDHINKLNNTITMHYIGNELTLTEREGIAAEISGTRYTWSQVQTFLPNKYGKYSFKVQGIEVSADKKEIIRVEIRWDNYKKHEVIELIHY